MGSNNEKQARAPFNFVSFPKEVFLRYESEDELPKFDTFNKDLNTGYIDYEFFNETELFVGGYRDNNKEGNRNKESNKVSFFRNANNDICIPGSSMRGVIRRNCEILSFSYPEFIEDRLFLYRNFADVTSKLKEDYSNVIKINDKENISHVVKAGYIYKDKYSYKLLPAKNINGKSFFLVDERDLMRIYNKNGTELPYGRINYMFKESIKDYNPKSEKVDENERKSEELKLWNEFLSENENSDYKPYKETVVYADINKNGNIQKINIRNIHKYKCRLYNTNTFISKNKDKNGNRVVKKKHYLINDIDKNKKPYILDEELVNSYKYDVKSNKKQIHLKSLPDKDGIQNAKIFFYKVIDNKVAYFGKTPYLRIFYNYPIRTHIKTKYTNSGIDYANAMFGYTKNNIKSNNTLLNKLNHSYKSRISFMDIVCKNPNLSEKPKDLILSSPKPTCNKLYIKQENKDKSNFNTYNDEDASLRGYKFYWNKRVINKKYEVKNKGIITTIKDVLKEKNKFNGRIYFENLTDDELGLLLLSIKFSKNSKESIGMGKPYGYGRININKIDLYLENIENKFVNFDNNYSYIENKEIYKNKFKEYISKKTNKKYMDYDSIIEYKKSKEMIRDIYTTSYMELDEFKNVGILPDIKEFN